MNNLVLVLILVCCVVLLTLPQVTEVGITSGSGYNCTHVQKCFNCGGNFSAVQLTGYSEDSCYNAVRQYQSVHYALYNTPFCRKFDDRTNTRFINDVPGRWQAWETCNDVCLEFTLNSYTNHMVVGATQYNSSTDASSLGHCFRECFDDSLCYTFVYSLNICYKYGCDGNCKLTSGGANAVYQRVCLRDCMPLMNTSQYAVTVTGGVTHGAIAKYTCKPYYSYQSGQLTRECQSNSTWSGIAPNCVADCGLPTPILNGSYTLSQGTTLGSTATLQCQAGFQLANGDSTLICDASSQWIGTQPVCEIIDCGQLGDLQNGLYNLSSGTQYGCIATASCLAGYTNQNTANIVCSDNGKWNGSLTDCTPVDCGPVQNIENGIVVATGSTFGQTANFYCIPGFKLIGPTLLKCNESSKWEPNLPSCRVKDTSSESLPKNLYIMPCICYNKTWTGLTQEQIIAHLIRNTSIDARNTTMALSKLSCRRDERPVSVIFGYVASGLIGGLFLLVVISDLPRLIHDFRFYF